MANKKEQRNDSLAHHYEQLGVCPSQTASIHRKDTLFFKKIVAIFFLDGLKNPCSL